MHYGALNNNPKLPKGIISSSSRRNNTNNPPTQNQQISKSTVYSCCTIKYSTQGGISWQIQHSALPRAVFVTRPHPLCCILSYSTRNGALTSIYITVDTLAVLYDEYSTVFCFDPPTLNSL